jgi:hypothetical protein
LKNILKLDNAEIVMMEPILKRKETLEIVKKLLYKYKSLTQISTIESDSSLQISIARLSKTEALKVLEQFQNKSMSELVNFKPIGGSIRFPTDPKIEMIADQKLETAVVHLESLLIELGIRETLNLPANYMHKFTRLFKDINDRVQSFRRAGYGACNGDLSQFQFLFELTVGNENIFDSILEKIESDVIEIDSDCEIVGPMDLNTNLDRNGNLVKFKSVFKDDSVQKKPKIYEEMVCCVCMDVYQANQGIQTSCNHFFCKDCFQNYLTHSCETKSYPIKCCFFECTQTISLQTIIPTTFVDQELKYKKKSNLTTEMIQQSFEAFIAKNDRYKFCPTPNCTQVYFFDTGIIECKQCNHKICSLCKTKDHPGLTCHEFQRSGKNQDVGLLEKWKNQSGVRGCPSCSVSIEKNQGCNHMTCHSCKKHFCWVCMGVFEPGVIYQHMQQEHGGNGL